MSHYQAYLKAVGTSDPKRNSSAPAGMIARKVAPYSTGTPVPPNESRSSNLNPNSPSTSTVPPHRTSSPTISARSSSPAPVYTPSAQFTAAAALTALSAHPPPAKPTDSSTKSPVATKSPIFSEPLRSQPLISDAQVSKALSHALALLQNASTYHGKRPFSALLVAPDNQSILLSHFSVSHIRHAESELARLASDQFSSTYLSHCTLVSTWELCAMCSGTVYWSGIGRVVYGASEEKLRELTGSGNEENMTMNLPCRQVLGSGQRDIDVIGPVPEWEEKIVEECRKWWAQHGGARSALGDAAGIKGSVNGVQTLNGHAKASSGSMVTTWTGEESVLSSIGEDGEYKADLDIDWMR